MRAVTQLKRQGVRTIIVTIHQGIRQTSYEGPTDPAVDEPDRSDRRHRASA